MYFHCNSHKLFAQNFSLRGIVKRTTSGASSVPFPDSRKAAETFESPALIVWYTHTHLLQKEYKCSENRRQLFRCTKHKFSLKLFLATQAASIVFPPTFSSWRLSHTFFLVPIYVLAFFYDVARRKTTFYYFVSSYIRLHSSVFSVFYVAQRA